MWAAFTLLAALLLSATAAAAPDPPLFNRDVRPILSDKCFACHGFDAKQRQADLRLDTSDGAHADRDGVRAVTPGDLAASALWERISSVDPDSVMPPPDTHKSLTDAEKDILKRWIESGAAYQKHWAFEPIDRPSVPEVAGTTHPVDAFLRARLVSSGLTVQPPADRETFVRRVSFALTGLPPTIVEIDAYLADTADGADGRMIDRYLASPRYGEEMARNWLDVARYADTHGLHLDNERQMWAYRDWVVKAFNDNLPYDSFTVWQIAGDLLPEPTTEQLVATGFNRCNVTTSEGGSIPEEFVYRYAVERTSAVAQAWLGLTAGCAVCHDHKYDPLTTREFYSLYAFFHSAADPAMDGNINITPPFLKLPTPAQQATSEAAARVEKDARAWLDALVQMLPYSDPAGSDPPPPRRAVHDTLIDETIPFGATSRSSSRNAVDWIVDPAFRAASGRRAIRQKHATDYNDQIEFKLRPVIVPHNATVEVSVRVDPLSIPNSVTLDFTGFKALTWIRKENRLVRVDDTDAITPGVWTKITLPMAECNLKPGDHVKQVRIAQNGGIAWWDALTLSGEADPATDPLESLTAWRKSLGTAIPPELPGDLHPLIQGGPDKPLADADAVRLQAFYLAVVARPQQGDLRSARESWEAARAARLTADEGAIGTFVFHDLPQPRESFVMLRGQYDKPGEQVEPGIPAALPQIARPSPDTRLTRLDLAKWLVAPENPLTARVTVNRIWQQFFGTGLVSTSYDFGAQGAPPSHPELLDWLASEFRDSGWNVKQFVKMLLLSDTFRQQSVVTEVAQATDPENRLLARFPRLRLDAEQVRDNALYVSGLIDLTMGGRGVKPYQPPNIWEPVGYSDSNTRYYLQDHGASLYRRSLYVFLKRTAPPPFMSNFDGPNREQVCTVRERSNTPLQALQLMNDVQHFEAARALAERTLADGGAALEQRLTFLYRTVLARAPTADERTLLAAALDRQTALFSASPENAAQAIHVGESKPRAVAPDVETAAWTMLANLILNLDEVVTRN